MLEIPLQLPAQKRRSWRILYAMVSSYPSQTSVIVLHMPFKRKPLFDYLRAFLNVHLYLSDNIFITKPNDREIVLSWERDKTISDFPYAWNFRPTCGHRTCGETLQHLIDLHLDQGTLIQVREHSEHEFGQCPSTTTISKQCRRVASRLWWRTYLKFYRSTFIALRPTRRVSLHSLHLVSKDGEQVLWLATALWNCKSKRPTLRCGSQTTLQQVATVGGLSKIPHSDKTSYVTVCHM